MAHHLVEHRINILGAHKRGTSYTSKVQIVGRAATAWIISSRGNQTDDSYEMSLCVDLLE